MKFITAACAGLAFVSSAAAADRCNAAATADWATAKIRIEAFASGATCDTATGVIVLRNEAGEPVHWAAYPSGQNMMVTGHSKQAELEAALKEWITVGGDTTESLPEWKEGAEMPMQGEFPFYVAEGIDRGNYNRIRALKAPLFCYVQGIESTLCLYPDKDSGGLLFEVGAQSFPG